MLNGFIERGFGKSMVVAVVVLVGINAYLCFKSKALEANITTTQAQIALIKKDNHNLAEQLEGAQRAIGHYRRQVKELHDNILSKMQTAEVRTSEILGEIEQHKNWANEPVPDELGRLLKHGAVSDGKTKSSDVSTQPTLPTIRPTNQD